jgi:hypothetical protein
VSQPVSTTDGGFKAEKFEWIESPLKKVPLERVVPIENDMDDYPIISPQDMP